LRLEVREKVRSAVTPIYRKALADAGLDAGTRLASVVQLIRELCEITEAEVA